MPARLVIPALVAVLLAAACAESPSDGTAFDVPALQLPDAGSGDGSEIGDRDTDLGPFPASSAGSAILVDDECFDGESRCGTALVPQTAGSADLVEMGYRVIEDGGSGVPVVLLEDPFAPVSLTPDAFADRPLVEIGSRTIWPGGPRITCPEWDGLAGEPDPAEIAARSAECVARLRATGIDLTGLTRPNLAADVISVLAELEVTEFDLIAPGARADLVAVIAASGLSMRRVVYVDPLFSGADPLVGQAERTIASLDTVWSRCGEVGSCSAPGSVDDFLAAVEELDRRPIPSTFDGGPDIDADRLAHAVLGEIERPTGAAFLPRLHQLLLDRDEAAVSSYVDLQPSDSAISGFMTACGRFTSTTDDYTSFPGLLRRRATEAAVFLGAACPEWDAPTEPPRRPPAGLTIATRSLVDSTGVVDATGPLIVEPTVGVPSNGCITTAVNAWFDEGVEDDRDCATPLAMDARADSFEFVTGRFFYDDDLSVRLSVPDTWTDWGGGTWYRDADPFDSTNLDVWIWEADSPEVALAEMVADWGLTDPTFSETSIGGRNWLFATGTPDYDPDFSSAIAVARIDDANIGVVLSAAGAELDDLIERVLTPALAGAALET